MPKTSKPAARQFVPDLMVLGLGALTLVCQLLVNTGQRPATVVQGLVGVALGLAAAAAYVVAAVGVPRALLWLSDPGDANRLAGTPHPGGTRRRPARGLLAALPLRAFAVPALGALATLALVDFARAGDLRRFVTHAALLCLLAWLVGMVASHDGKDGDRATDSAPPGQPTLERWTLALLCAACVLVTLIACRPDKDEAFYLAMAGSLLREPNLPTLGFDPVHGVLDWPLQVATYRAHSYEVFAGALAWLTGIKPIHWTHMVFPAVAAACAPLAWHRLMSELWPRQATLATGLTLLLLMADGGSNQSYGNFAFVRLFQGKAILLTVMLPLVLAHAVRFARAPTLPRFCLMVASQVAATGASSTAIPLVPIVSGTGILAVALGQRWPWRLWLGCLGCAYPILLGGYFYGQMLGSRSLTRLAKGTGHALGQVATSETQVDAAARVEVALHKVLSDAPIGWAYLAAAVLLPVIAPNRALRRLAAISGLVFFGVLANPQLADLVAAHLFGQSTYWRIFWALPLPAYLALCSMAISGWLLSRVAVPRPRWLGVGLPVLLVAALGLSLPAHGVLTRSNSVRLGWPGLKVKAGAYRAAARVSALAPRRTSVVAPRDVAMYLGAFAKPVYAVFAKKSYLKPKHRKVRGRLSRCVTRLRCPTPWLIKALLRYPIGGAVVVDLPSPVGMPPATALRATGFSLVDTLDGYQIWTRPRSR